MPVGGSDCPPSLNPQQTSEPSTLTPHEYGVCGPASKSRNLPIGPSPRASPQSSLEVSGISVVAGASAWSPVPSAVAQLAAANASAQVATRSLRSRGPMDPCAASAGYISRMVRPRMQARPSGPAAQRPAVLQSASGSWSLALVSCCQVSGRLPMAGRPSLSRSILAVCIRFHDMKVVLRLVKSLS